MYRNAKKINILGLRCRKLRTFLGKFLNFGKSAGVKGLTNIMSVCTVLKNIKMTKITSRLRDVIF